MSLFMAKLVGPVMVVTALHFLIDAKRYNKVVDDFFKNAGVLFMTAFITFVLGLIMVVMHNVWVGDWRVLITLAGWSMFLKGGLYLLFPKTSESLVRHFSLNNASYWVALIVILVWGGYLSYVGYFM